MKLHRRILIAGAASLIAFTGAGNIASAQMGKSLGVIDVNAAAEKDLAALPHLTPEIVKTIVGARPFDSIIAFNKHLLAQKLTQEQANELYAKAFVPVNLNTATSEEILLIPGAGKKMTHEFKEYRPWKTWAQFQKEIGKYVGAEGAARLAQYCFIPMNANKATEEDLATIPGISKPTIEQITKGKPWKTADDLKKELAKPPGSEKDAARITRFLVVQ